MILSTEHIVRVSGSPLRTVQDRLKKWHARGGPVTRVARPGGGWQYSVALDAYAARVARDPDELRAALAEAA